MRVGRTIKENASEGITKSLLLPSVIYSPRLDFEQLPSTSHLLLQLIISLSPAAFVLIVLRAFPTMTMTVTDDHPLSP